MVKQEIARKAPVIKSSYGPEKVRYGDAVRFYIEAESPEGHLLKIASVAEQAGYGHYPTDWIYLKPPYPQHLRGYLQWNTSSSSLSSMREWTWITLNVSVFDKEGYESNEVSFAFQFVSEAVPESLPSPPFSERDPRIGHIHIQLFGFTDAH